MTRDEAVAEAKRRGGPKGHADRAGYSDTYSPLGSYHCQVGILHRDCLWVCGTGATWEEAFATARVWWDESWPTTPTPTQGV